MLQGEHRTIATMNKNIMNCPALSQPSPSMTPQPSVPGQYTTFTATKYSRLIHHFHGTTVELHIADLLRLPYSAPFAPAHAAEQDMLHQQAGKSAYTGC